VATDGHRLATADVQSTLPKGKVLIPTRALREVSRLLSADDEVSVSADENHVAFHLERRVILARKLTGNFPDYHRVLPDNKSLRYIDVDVASWKKAIKRVSVFSDERSKCVRFNIEHGVLNIHAKVSEDGEATNSLKLASNGFSYESGFNAKFLLEGLDELAKDASVRFAICRGEKAGEQMAQFVTDHYRYAVMPMRI
jgi:DNA polymerase-3 subunit beta